LAVVVSTYAQEEIPSKEIFKQVQMQVFITETTEEGLRDIGNNLQYKRVVGDRETNGSVRQVNTNVFNPDNGDFRVTLPSPMDLPDSDGVLRPDLEPGRPGLQTQTGAGLEYQIIGSDYGTLEGVFRAIEQKADVDLISKPELLVIDGQLATIHAGQKTPYQKINYDKARRPSLAVTWRDVGVKMGIRPQIQAGDDMIKLQIDELDVSDIARTERSRGIDLPVFSSRSQTGAVLVPNGQTVVIGGLTSRVVRKNETRIPIVGRIPLLGIPFRGRNSEAAITHLLILVSPTVVDLRELTPDAMRAMNFWQEDRWRYRENVDEEIVLLEEEL
jgi:general secretion pathway protein D